MKIKLNDQTHEVVEGTSVASLLEALGINSKGIAVAMDYKVLPKDKWTETVLSDGIELVMIQAVQGG